MYLPIFSIYSFHFLVHPCDKPSKGGCDHTCTKEGEKAVCSCNNGFKLADDGQTCLLGEYTGVFFISIPL